VAPHRAHRGRERAAARTKATAVGARYRRIMPHRGHRKAIVAVGRHILEISYHLLATATTYHELGADYFDRRHAERVQRRCVRQLERLGLRVTLTPAPGGGVNWEVIFRAIVGQWRAIVAVSASISPTSAVICACSACFLAVGLG
jgi:hypothetical protein